MLNKLVLACAVTSLATSANAAWGLKFEVSSDGGATWTNNLFADSGQVIRFRVGAYFDAGTMITTADGTGQALWLNRFTGSNQWTNLAGDSISGLTWGLSNGNPMLMQVSGGTIGTTSPQSFGSNLALASLPESPIFYSEIYSGNLTIANGPVRAMTWGSKTFGTVSIKGLTFYNDGSLANKLSGSPDGNPTHLTATVIYMPTPSTLALAGLGGLVVARRRRF